MSDDTTAVAPETGASDDTATDQIQTETVETLTEKLAKYKEIARTQEKRARENAAAAKELEAIKQAQMTAEEKAAHRMAEAEKMVAAVPNLVAEALKGHLVELHQIDPEDAELFLTATEPELLLKQAARFVSKSGSKSNHVPTEGRNHGTAMPLNGDGLEQALRAKLGIA